MKKTYRDFLSSIGVISEDQFNNLMLHLPDVDIEFDFNNLYSSDYGDIDSIASSIISSLLEDFECVYVDELDSTNYTLCLHDVVCFEDLEKIKNLLSGWQIYNYDDIISYLEEEEIEKNLDKKKVSLLNIISSLPEEEIDKLLEKYHG